MKVHLILLSLLLLAARCNNGHPRESDPALAMSNVSPDTVVTQNKDDSLSVASDWYFSADGINADTLLLVKKRSALHSYEVYEIHLDTNGMVKTALADHQPRCGNGILWTDTSRSKWSLRNETLVLTLSGAYALESQIESKMEYRIDSAQPGTWKLIRKRNVYYKITSPASLH